MTIPYPAADTARRNAGHPGEEASRRQRRASDPASSVWTGASAGTGKTKVLTDRVLRLLLPRLDGTPGTAPQRILCLTFTKAGASEMQLRVHEILGAWAVTGEVDLRAALAKLMGTDVPDHFTDAARALFARVIDTPGGLQIRTIHSFCKSVLSRFPLEAGLPPQFEEMDETAAAALLRRARDRVIATVRLEEESALAQSLRRLSGQLSEDDFNKTIANVCGERLALIRLRDTHGDDFHRDMCRSLGLDPDKSPDDLRTDICRGVSGKAGIDETGLRAACAFLAESGKATAGDRKRAAALQDWLDSDIAGRAANLQSYISVFLTKEHTVLSHLVSRNTSDNAPDLAAVLTAEAERLIAALGHIRLCAMARNTADLICTSLAILAEYEAEKRRAGALDYDDLILFTLALLKKADIAPWIMFKLDGGLDHILIDEAQDTNPDQWEIIEKLTEEFFAGMGARENVNRTVFTVGDEKQSIYSFQRAAPELFDQMKKNFDARIRAAGGRLSDETLNISFRSVPAVLRLVDEIFRPEEMRRGLGESGIRHESNRTGQAGLCELWPLFEQDEDGKADDPPGSAAGGARRAKGWILPVAVTEQKSPPARLAEHIGQTVAGWLETGEMLSSHARPIRPGDIMVLVRSRTSFVAQLVRALKTRNIPVSGLDRMVVTDQISVKDLMAAADFALLPDDDLSLAALLKSPLIGWDDARLYEVAIDRKGSLWQALKETRQAEGGLNVVAYLQALIHAASADHPYEFFSKILQQPCPGDAGSGKRALIGRLGQDIADPLDEFLNIALAYERDNIPSLQAFMVWNQQSKREIKREMEEAGGHVRIMTVHGSKGLQAPIVILPDTTRTPQVRNRAPALIWPGRSGLDYPLWVPRRGEAPDMYRQAWEASLETADEEYRRLLYVALTRAEERLYIGGSTGKHVALPGSWYYYVKEAFERLPDVSGVAAATEGLPVLRLQEAQTAAPDKQEGDGVRDAEARLPLPAFLFAPAPETPEPPRPLSPSRAPEDEPAVRSPLDAAGDYRFRRGNVTHRLLQLLPDLPEERRREAAMLYAAQPAHGLPDSIRREVVDEVMNIIGHAEFAPLFGPRSLAEIPVTGLVGGRVVSAQIDRMLLTEEEAWIVDYKSNRPSPRAPGDVPDAYVRQLRAYRDIIAAIYPGRRIRCFLLWTETAYFMEIPMPLPGQALA